ncbi:MAG: hypothetical protein WA151_00930 [Desulfatirhabdiaceae bacterium]
MSKYMQLTVTVRPYYQKNLEATYPKLTYYLKYLDSNLVDRNPSLYELVGQLDQLLHRLEGTPLREILLRYSEKLRNLHKNIQDNIADWKLAEVDKLLYSMEDIFDEIEMDPALDTN